MLRRYGLLAAALMCLTDAATAQPRADEQGDGLPAGALRRLGTLRWHHGTGIYFVAILPDNKAVLTASRDHVIRLWDLPTGKEIRRFESSSVKQPFRPVLGRNAAFGPADNGRSSVAVASDGKTLAAVLPNKVIQLWETQTGKEIRQFKAPGWGADALIFPRSGKLLALRDFNFQAINLLDAEDGDVRELKKLPNDGKVMALWFTSSAGMVFSPDGTVLANGKMGFDQVKNSTFVQLIDVKTGEEIQRFDANGKCPSGIAFAPNRKSRDHQVRLWDAESGNLRHEWGDAVPLPAAGNLPFSGVNEGRDLAWSADGKIVAWGDGQTVRLWDAVAGKDLAPPAGHRAAVSALAVSADGKTLVSRGEDDTLRRWDLLSGKQFDQKLVPAGTTFATFAPILLFPRTARCLLPRARLTAQFTSTLRTREATSGKSPSRCLPLLADCGRRSRCAEDTV
jgi:WD40 repeat protein